MVVSKESKRKRKDSPLPPQPTTAVSVELECSPEMPRRTKVQAQRKFAQGQTAPTTATVTTFNLQNLATSSTSTGPSTSNESREKPTEILPNKRPKTEDFLTFLCFRGTSALPPHLDFFDQGKSKEAEIITKRNIPKPAKPTKKGGKRGRPKSCYNKTNPESKEEITIVKGSKRAKNDDTVTPPIDNCETVNEENKKEETNLTNKDAAVMPFAVRKRAEIIAEGNRRGRSSDKCNNSVEVKRRSNRTAAREMKSLVETETDDDDDNEYLVSNEVGGKLNDTDKNPATLTNNDTQNIKDEVDVSKSECPTKENESNKCRKGRVVAAKKGKENSVETLENIKDIPKTEEKAGKEKAPIKRSRQKESPIFIPSPEPSGRMTRQRAFFEPVKVPQRDEIEEKTNVETTKEQITTIKETIQQKQDNKINQNGKVESKSRRNNTTPKEEILNETKTDTRTKNKSNLNIFDFSSDDEQPLAKTIKTKKENTSPKKTNLRNAKINKNLRKTPETLETQEKIEGHVNTETIVSNTETLVEEKSKIATIGNKETNFDSEKSMKGKRGKMTKKESEKNDSSEGDNKPTASPQLAVQSPQSIPSKKNTNNSRQSKKKAFSTKNDDEAQASTRNQRPSRKTKEAAAIYMGIIGHKLQADEEDDDLSLNSFPDLPNVKEMEKMEQEIKKNATQPITNEIERVSLSPTRQKTVSKQANLSTPPKAVPISATVEKPTGGRRGRPPKQNKQQKPHQQLPPKREIEGMLVKKGAIAKLTANTSNTTATTADCTVITATKLTEFNTQTKSGKFPSNKLDSYEDEDFLLNEEVNETKRKLEKSFSDSDDEPLAIKASTKPSEKDNQSSLQKNAITTINSTPSLTILPLTTKTILTSPPNTNVQRHADISPVGNIVAQTTPSPFKAIEKKSPVPTSKILNIPATYGIPSTNLPALASFKTTSYLPQASVHYQAPHLRPATTHQFPIAKSPSAPPPLAQLLNTPALPALSPLKYQSPAPTTYPPPIEAYPSPKINPNFLTPKFDRANMPRPNNFPTPSPVKFDLSTSTNKTSLVLNTTLSPKTPTSIAIGPSFLNTSTVVSNSNDPLKDEIGSILAANLMPSKEESGKIFGIASVSLAQSSGPDNTKCTLGKCGSIHKPVLGPVVPTEVYIGDQLSGKERRKAKVNMSHEQIQKWLMECSSNPDVIHDDLDDEYDDNLRPNLNAVTPPPRDDKESTTFSSSSKATRDLGKSESAWSAKGPSLKATPVVSSTNRRDDVKQTDTSILVHETSTSNKVIGGHALNLTHKINQRQTSNVNAIIANNTIKNSNNTTDAKQIKEKVDKKADKRIMKDDKTTSKEITSKDNKTNKGDKDKEIVSVSSLKTNAANKQAQNSAGTTIQQAATSSIASTAKQTKRGKIVLPTQTPIAATDENKRSVAKSDEKSIVTNATTPPGKTSKRTPVYNLKTPKPVELKETTTTSHKKSAPFSYGAFSADNEKSIYSFDKDDDDDEDDPERTGTAKPKTSKAAVQRQSGRDSQSDEISNAVTPATPATAQTPPTKKRAAAAAAEKANKEIANASQNSSVSLTLSPTEKSKLVKVSLDTEKVSTAKSTVTNRGTKNTKKNETINTKKTEPVDEVEEQEEGEEEESHTFYIPLQSSGSGADGEGGIQGVAVKLGREGPDGPNQKVIMHATLVTKAQMGANTKPLPDTMNVSDIVKNLVTPINSITTNVSDKNGSTPTTSAAAAAACVATTSATTNSASNSLKNVPIGTVQPRFKVNEATTVGGTTGTNSNSISAGRLVRVNSNSSLFSGSAKSRIGNAGGGSTITHLQNKKFKDDTPIKMSNNTAFPRHDDPTQMVEAPVFRPTEKEFADPIEFIERITPIAARFGICKIIPPANFKPECRISDEMRFTAYNQYVHKMLHRWGPSAKEMSAIKKYLATQSIVMNHPPWIGGMEVDLPRLYHTVQELGGLKEVIEKKKWARVAEEMCIPKLAQDRVTKLDDIYCKYLLPYDTLSPAERQKLFDEVEADWAKREARARRNADRFVNTESVSNEEDEISSDDDEESEEEVDGVSMECIVKGRSMPLSQFYRIARNTMALWFKNTEPTVNEVEAEFWRHVAVRDSHVCVHSGSIDSSGWGYGFPSPGPKGKGSNYARHPWNLKVLTNNPGSVLRSLGPVMGVTVPTLHVGMLFSACCWYRDPHGLSWIEYLHTGASKLWYGIPDDQSANFRTALTSLIPTHCQNKTIWLPCDTVMVPPHMLTDRGVSLCRIEQKPGEFIVVFPRAYTSSLATGYVVSESVYFATTTWLDLAKDDFRDIHDSCEPAMFSLEQLLFALGYDQRVTIETLQQMLPMLNEVIDKETAAREQLKAAGVIACEKLQGVKSSKTKKAQQPPLRAIENECDLCRANLYISLIKTEDDNIYCLQHALKNINNGNIQAKQCKLIYAYDVEDIEILIKNIKDKMQHKQRNTITNKKSK